jgi:hypothetical protein
MSRQQQAAPRRYATAAVGREGAAGSHAPVVIYGELEWEHAVTSAYDQGESEVEQLYVEHALAPSYGVRAGLMLVPLGLLNEHHEPTNYYGVERNFIETAIIPSTWREGGVALYGNTDAGFNWNVGIGTGPDLSKWDPASDEGRESPLGSIHQELQLAKARDPSVYAAANWQVCRDSTLVAASSRARSARARRTFPPTTPACSSAKRTCAGNPVRSTYRRCTREARSAIRSCST